VRPGLAAKLPLKRLSSINNINETIAVQFVSCKDQKKEKKQHIPHDERHVRVNPKMLKERKNRPLNIMCKKDQLLRFFVGCRNPAPKRPGLSGRATPETSGS
jgi:hypothetical protein